MSARIPPEPTCWARGALDVMAYAAGRGLARHHFGSRAARLGVPEQRIPVSLYYDVVETAAVALDDPLFGVSYIEQVQPASMDAVGFLAMASSTLGEALARVIRHHRWITDGERFELDVAAGMACFSYVPWGPPRLAHAHVADMYAADCLVLAPRITGAPVSVLSFSLAHAPLAPLPDYQRRFGALPQFGARRNTWCLPAEVLDRPLPGADPGLVRFFSRYLEERHGVAPRPSPSAMVDQVRQRICEGLPDGCVPTLAQLAAQLHCSERSLQRRLSEAGLSLTGLVDEVRRTRAVACLEIGLSASETALLLGYADPAGFHRAFKRWTGRPASQWRPGPA
ncbi:AraC family transcriptional regulator [Acidovorax radicis]|uniref:AraC family transcriptional regulator n=1 Tax=Acidovorax radicis TaxID=758826 RepID=UPI0002376D7B|nr:AraC family transcriptional regulator [Acidovorax radicis]